MENRTPARPTIDVTGVDLGGDVVIVTDADGVIVDVNPAFAQVTGYSREEAIGATPRLLSSGLQPPETYSDMWSTILAGRTWSGQLVDRHRDGSLRTHQVTLTPRLDEQGHLRHIVAVQRDLSAELVRQGGSSTMGTLHTDPSGRCVYADAEASRLLGVPTAELFGDGWRYRLEEEDAFAAQEAAEAAISSGREQRIDVRTRRQHWLHVVIDPLRAADGTVLGASWTLQDTTALLDLHQRLAREDALIAALLEAHEDPLAVVDGDGVIVATNTAWSRSKDDEHPVLDTTIGDHVIDRLRSLGADGDTLAARAARHLAAEITGVPPVGDADDRLVTTPILADDGGTILRLPRQGSGAVARRHDHAGR